MPDTFDNTGPELLTNEEMSRADQMTIASGVSSFTLMRRAATHVANVATEMLGEIRPHGRPRIVVLCGPGNNGGDGFVAAQLLKDRGNNVTTFLFGRRDQLSEDCQRALAFWTEQPANFDAATLDQADLIIDAIFGAGLNRKPHGDIANAICDIQKSQTPVLAIDLPSGINGNSGKIDLGPNISANRTVTFFRLKPGHLIAESREDCGELSCYNIGISKGVLKDINPKTFENKPELWRSCFPLPQKHDHKYIRGHAVIMSGCAGHSGAARLAAHAALRIGAGLVTIASPADAMAENAAQLTAVMLKQIDDVDVLKTMLQDKRIRALTIGPATGLDPATRLKTQVVLSSGVDCVLDADALTMFSPPQGGKPDKLFKAIAENPDRKVVLTPHDGEFRKLFPDILGDKLSRARAAARLCGATVVLKGPDTIVAEPSGTASINASAPPWLATAGAGDVLSGTICGLLARGLPSFEAASASVWIHGMAAHQFGMGLIAEDIADQYPNVLKELFHKMSDL